MKEIIIKDLEKIFNSLEIYDAAWLFGSYSKNTHNSNSDLDIGFIANKKVTLKDLTILMDKIQSITNIEKIDLVDLKSSNYILNFEVISGKLIYSKNNDILAETVSLISRMYEDCQNNLKIGLYYRNS